MAKRRRRKPVVVPKDEPIKTVNGLIESRMPFDRNAFDSDMEFILAKDVYEDLQLRGTNFKDVTPQIIVYAKCMTKALQILEKIDEKYTVPTERSGHKSNPLFKVAMELLDKARQYSHILGIDPKTRSTMLVILPVMPDEKPENKGKPGNNFLSKM